MREVSVQWSTGKFAQKIEVGGHQLTSDEVPEKGGDGTAATPHELVLAGLGACTAMTLKVYAERKGWPLRDVRVKLSGNHAEGRFAITRELVLDGPLDAEQRQRLIEIADKCPVHKTLIGDITIQTTGVSP